MLREELLDRGVPICVPCGYTLIGLTGPSCPECGKPFGARVQEILDTDAPADPPTAE
jgi:rubrerythrin